MLATKLSTSTLLATARPIASTSSSTFSLQRLLLSTSSKAKSATRTSTSSSNSNYYVATLPWASHKAGTDRFTTLTKDVRFSQNDNIVASSITTSKRSSPIAASLKAKLDTLHTTAHRGGGAWLLLRAKSQTEAEKIVNQSNEESGLLFDLDNASIQSIDLTADGHTHVQNQGPLYAVSAEGSAGDVLVTHTIPEDGVNTYGPLYGK